MTQVNGHSRADSVIVRPFRLQSQPSTSSVNAPPHSLVVKSREKDLIMTSSVLKTEVKMDQRFFINLPPNKAAAILTVFNFGMYKYDGSMSNF